MPKEVYKTEIRLPQDYGERLRDHAHDRTSGFKSINEILAAATGDILSKLDSQKARTGKKKASTP